MKNLIIPMLLMMVTISGCTSTSIDIPERPNSYTFGHSKQKTKEAIVSALTLRSFQILKDTEFQLVMDQPQHTTGAVFVHGSQFNSIPNGRVILTITGDNPTNIHTKTQIVTNPGSAFELVRDYDDKTFRNRVYLGIQEAKASLNNQ